MVKFFFSHWQSIDKTLKELFQGRMKNTDSEELATGDLVSVMDNKVWQRGQITHCLGHLIEVFLIDCGKDIVVEKHLVSIASGMDCTVLLVKVLYLIFFFFFFFFFFLFMYFPLCPNYCKVCLPRLCSVTFSCLEGIYVFFCISDCILG